MHYNKHTILYYINITQTLQNACKLNNKDIFYVVYKLYSRRGTLLSAKILHTYSDDFQYKNQHTKLWVSLLPRRYTFFCTVLYLSPKCNSPILHTELIFLKQTWFSLSDYDSLKICSKAVM